MEGSIRSTCLVALVLLTSSACTPEHPPRHAVLLVSDGGAVQPTRALTYAFGPSVAGTQVKRQLVVRNGGDAELRLDSLEVEEGDAAHLGLSAGSTAVFRIPFPAGTRLPPGGEQTLDVTFAPRLDTGRDEEGRVALTVRLRTSGPRTGEETATLALSGQAVVPGCALPSHVSFGKVLVGGRGQESFDIHNGTPLPTTALIGELAGPDLSAFAFAAGSAFGSTSLEPGAYARVALEFRPTEARAYMATLRARAAEGCPELFVELEGTSVETLLTWQVDNAEACRNRLDGVCVDASVDCGFSAPGTPAAQRRLTFRNVGRTAIALSQLTPSSEDFFLVAPEGADATRLDVPGANPDTQAPGEASLQVGCRPMEPGMREGTLAANSNLAGMSALGPIALSVFGGGPQLGVSPDAVDFGTVAHVTGATTPLSLERELEVRNTGSAPRDARPWYNLQLVHSSETDGGHEQPFYEVVPGEGTAPGEFQVVLAAGQGLSEAGLRAQQGDVVRLIVRVTPASAGLKRATLRLHSNDPDSPVTEVSLAADAQAFGPCTFTLMPHPSQGLDFGVVAAGTERELVVRFVNTGSNACLVSQVGLATGSDAAFRVDAAGPVTVAPGAIHPLAVRASLLGAPPAPRLLAGTLRLRVSSLETPEVQVPVRARVAESCLVVHPDTLDFGTVQSGCGSDVRTVQVHNTCQDEVLLQGASMVLPAGLPAGAPGCSGSEPCHEFRLLAAPAIPNGGLRLLPGGQPVSVQVMYRPFDAGEDVGALRLNVSHLGNAHSYLATLRGTGALVEGHTDRFHREVKSDVLFVVDNSASMFEAQAHLANNIGAFLAEASTGSTDLHLGVITTDMDAPTESGRLQAVPGVGTKVLTDANPNLEANLAQLITSLGTQGSASEQTFESAVRALTAPLVTLENAGFLRPDAVLTVVAVTDEPEQSAFPITSYLHRFRNLKGASQPHRFTFHAVASLAGTLPCTGVVDDGRLAFLVEQTGGVLADLCAADWQAPLREMGRRAAGLRLHHTLTSIPDLSGGRTLQLTRVGTGGQRQVLHATDGVGGNNWSYDAPTNGLLLEEAQSLQPGETLEVHYTPVCHP